MKKKRPKKLTLGDFLLKSLMCVLSDLAMIRYQLDLITKRLKIKTRRNP